jgi:tetratricopeptide (TPR) repeat protein
LIALISTIRFLNTFIKAGQKDEAFKRVEEFKSQAAPPLDEVVPLVYLGFYVLLEDVEKATIASKDVESTPLGPMFEGNRPNVLIYQGRIHEMKGEFEEAITAYKKSLELRPTDIGTNVLIGRSYRKLKAFKKAEEYFHKCLKTGPFDPELHYELSLLYFDIKEKKKALENLNIALGVWKNADPGIPEVEEARKKLAELKVPEIP